MSKAPSPSTIPCLSISPPDIPKVAEATYPIYQANILKDLHLFKHFEIQVGTMTLGQHQQMLQQATETGGILVRSGASPLSFLTLINSFSAWHAFLPASHSDRPGHPWCHLRYKEDIWAPGGMLCVSSWLQDVSHHPGTHKRNPWVPGGLSAMLSTFTKRPGDHEGGRLLYQS